MNQSFEFLVGGAFGVLFTLLVIMRLPGNRWSKEAKKEKDRKRRLRDRGKNIGGRFDNAIKVRFPNLIITSKTSEEDGYTKVWVRANKTDEYSIVFVDISLAPAQIFVKEHGERNLKHFRLDDASINEAIKYVIYLI